MAKDPALLFYTADFLTGTLTMTNEHVGMYIKLLCLQHQKGRLAESDMLYICSTHVKDVYSKFAKDDNDLYYNKRLESEALRRIKYSESRRKNVSKRYATYVEHMETETITETITKNKAKNHIKKEVFRIPTIEQVSSYIKEIGFLIDPEYFLDYQTAREWRLKGGQKIKDWKAVLRTWKKNGINQSKSSMPVQGIKEVPCDITDTPEDGYEVVCTRFKDHAGECIWKRGEALKTPL